MRHRSTAALDLAIAAELADLIPPHDRRGLPEILAIVRWEWNFRRDIQPDELRPRLGGVQPTPGEMKVTIEAGAKHARMLRKWSHSLLPALFHNVNVPIIGGNPPATSRDRTSGAYVRPPVRSLPAKARPAAGRAACRAGSRMLADPVLGEAHARCPRCTTQSLRFQGAAQTRDTRSELRKRSRRLQHLVLRDRSPCSAAEAEPVNAQHRCQHNSSGGYRAVEEQTATVVRTLGRGRYNELSF